MLSQRHYEVRVYGTRGMILQELWQGTMEYHDLDCKITRYPSLPEEDIYPFLEPAKNLVDAVTGAAPNRSPALYGALAMEVIELLGREGLGVTPIDPGVLRMVTHVDVDDAGIDLALGAWRAVVAST